MSCPASPARSRLSVLRRRRRSGTAAVEFALVAPVLLLMLAGIFDTGSMIINARRLQVAATAVATIATTLAAGNATNTTITDYQAFQATTGVVALFPWWKQPSAVNTFSVTLSAVNFLVEPAGCTSGCSYKANVLWSMSSVIGKQVYRPCGAPTMVRNGVTPTMSTLPNGLLSPSLVYVADVSANFKPMFSSMLIGPISLLRSAYITPYIGNTSTFSTSKLSPNLSGGTQLPDYVICPIVTS